MAIYRDIVERHQIKTPSIIKYMILSIIGNSGKCFSIHKFYNELKSGGYSIGKDSLYEYADYIEDAYLAFSIGIYDESIRKERATPKKLYAIDPGLIRALTLEYEKDLGRLFKNIVYLDLRRQGYKVYYYLTAERYEVDFVVKNSLGQKKLFQVAWNMEDQKTAEREERGLKAGMQELQVKGEIITLDSYLSQGGKLFKL